MTTLPPLVLAVVVLLVAPAVAAAAYPPAATGGSLLSLTRYARMFAFGNSLTDTGNGAIFPLTAGGTFMQPPYGETYFGYPNGRASDGRLVIDFLAQQLKVPLPTPYLAGTTAADFLNGTNFAVGGATALDSEFLANLGIQTAVPISFSNQTSWFNNVLRLLSTSGYEQRRIMARSVFFVGEMGFNDYTVALVTKPVDDVASLVPHVIGTIRSALTAMIGAGARTVVVTGMLPIGCEPSQLALFPGEPGDYDPASGCNARLNELAAQHNRALRRMLWELGLRYPGRSLHYAGMYSPVMALVTSPAANGFGDTPLAACCGGGDNPYNFDYAYFCGTPLSTACADPSKYVSWDGIHYTEAAYKFIADSVLKGLLSVQEPAGSQQASGDEKLATI
ncbi:hypothetical protein U9M48_009029 [Paspalum notatum var. saurae]|uniref:GDSL esterase/lipase n=1 Tax=Paspalum notatum var. saurae TaxID=547442 RepID=A0AAQ3SQD3_PASNO